MNRREFIGSVIIAGVCGGLWPSLSQAAPPTREPRLAPGILHTRPEGDIVFEGFYKKDGRVYSFCVIAERSMDEKATRQRAAGAASSLWRGFHKGWIAKGGKASDDKA